MAKTLCCMATQICQSFAHWIRPRFSWSFSAFCIDVKIRYFSKPKAVQHLWNARQRNSAILKGFIQCEVSRNQPCDEASCKDISIINCIRRDTEPRTREGTAPVSSMLRMLNLKPYTQVCMPHLKHVQRKKPWLLKALKWWL